LGVLVLVLVLGGHILVLVLVLGVQVLVLVLILGGQVVVLVLVPGGQVLVLVLVLWGQVLVNIPDTLFMLYCIVSSFNTLSTNRNSCNRCKIILRYDNIAKT